VVGEVSKLAHWDCWGSPGTMHVDRPEPNTTPERAMELLLEKARLILGEQDWAAWTWNAKDYGTQARRVLRFKYEGGGFVRVPA
jgi:hypothetical protein